MATHSSILAWKNPTDREPGGLQSKGGHKEPDMTEKLTMVYVNTDSITASCFYFSRSGQHLFNKGLHLRATGLTQARSQWADVGTKQAGSTHAITPLKDE